MSPPAGFAVSPRVSAAALGVFHWSPATINRWWKSQLTDRELQCFRLVGLALPTRTIAEKRGVSVKTVEAHRENIKNKLGLDSGAALTARAAHWTRQPPSAPRRPPLVPYPAPAPRRPPAISVRSAPSSTPLMSETSAPSESRAPRDSARPFRRPPSSRSAVTLITTLLLLSTFPLLHTAVSQTSSARRTPIPTRPVSPAGGSTVAFIVLIPPSCSPPCGVSASVSAGGVGGGRPRRRPDPRLPRQRRIHDPLLNLLRRNHARRA